MYSRSILIFFQTTFIISLFLFLLNLEYRDATKQEGHTLEAVKLVEASLKKTITDLFKNLFPNAATLNSRWVDATFP
ncbi:unnamed protein product, partial [Rotaria magnacalcarata]